MRLGAQDDRPAAASITAIRAALGHKGFAPERAAAISAVASFGKDSNVIDKHGMKTGAEIERARIIAENPRKANRRALLLRVSRFPRRQRRIE
jgi:hypothetical protein